MELDAIPQPELEQIERAGGVELVVGFFGMGQLEDGSDAAAITRDALGELAAPMRAVVVCNNGIHSGANGDDRSPIAAVCSLPLPGPAETPLQSISRAYRRVFAIGSKLGVRACAFIASGERQVSREWISRLVQPVLDLGFDCVAPCYSRQKMEGLLNRNVVAPLHRALYGEQLENPMGPDFGVSGKLLERIRARESARRAGSEHNVLAAIAATAAAGGFQVCETHLGDRTQHPTDWGKLSELLAEVLGAIFVEMEVGAAYWQSIRGSKALPRFGAPEVSREEGGTVDVRGMIESFQLGTQNLQDVWGLILPPTTLLELKRLSRVADDRFRIQDQLWVRIVYDFALAHRLRTISRDHLLRSITPLYLGWIASYALEMETAGFAQVESRLERLSKAYEDNKSYLVSRWRWPDRFNP
ncbi:MAG: hypothetical protein M3O20_12790 [Acidobacteriota bacterium]|nr:hypothetical protein [Acidobacteriota bacterium]